MEEAAPDYYYYCDYYCDNNVLGALEMGTSQSLQKAADVATKTEGPQ